MSEIVITNDRSKIEFDRLATFIENAYWGIGRSRETIRKSFEGSICFVALEDDVQVGFARVITDGAVLGYICDVIVFEAYRGRGGDDPIMSHDLEDVLIVIDGREELIDDVAAADDDVRSFIAAEIRALQAHGQFDSFVAGNIRGPEGRVDLIYERLDALAASDGGA